MKAAKNMGATAENTAPSPKPKPAGSFVPRDLTPQEIESLRKDALDVEPIKREFARLKAQGHRMFQGASRA